MKHTFHAYRSELSHLLPLLACQASGPQSMTTKKREALRKLGLMMKNIHHQIEGFLGRPIGSSSAERREEPSPTYLGGVGVAEDVSFLTTPNQDFQATVQTNKPNALSSIIRGLAGPAAPHLPEFPDGSDVCSNYSNGIRSGIEWLKYGKKPRHNQYGNGNDCGADEVWRHYYHCKKRGCPARKIVDDNVTAPRKSCVIYQQEHTCKTSDPKRDNSKKHNQNKPRAKRRKVEEVEGYFEQEGELSDNGGSGSRSGSSGERNNVYPSGFHQIGLENELDPACMVLNQVMEATGDASSPMHYQHLSP